ncbi:NADH-quinone oxidoreductase subunit NuoN [Fretibacter rubidus]|uniref:NADH-quinone oxidoreductase subunit NuoN n=1 Tax=Fretibacter rubidus TaxID=570162 RepID=UPI00352BA084
MWEKIIFFLPELILAVTASNLLLFGVSGGQKRTDLVRYIGILALLAFAFSSFFLGMPVGTAFHDALIVDNYGHYAKLILGLAAATALIFARPYLLSEKLDKYEYTVLLLYAVLGMSIMVSANNLLAIYIGIELQALALYIMAAWNRDSLRASEAGLKYFVLGALSSGLLLYGLSMVYGFTGSLDFDRIATVIEDGASPGLIAGMVFMLCGLGFKISAAPFHMWTPDVYEGSPTPVTGFFAGAPKFAAMILIGRVLVGPFGGIEDQWQQVIVVFAVLSMFVGAIGALAQTNIKRLMAYSSIANMGYALVPLAAGGEAGIRGMLIFMSIYIITTVGIFACILQMRIRNGMVEQISDLAGLSKSNSGLAIILTILMFSLAGIPPLLGFFGKWYAFSTAADAGLLWLVVLALIASVIGAFYYLRIIKNMWGDDVVNEFVEAPRSLRFITLASALLILPLMILPFSAQGALGLISTAAASLF